MVGVLTSKVIYDMIVAKEFAQCDSVAQLNNYPEVQDYT